MKLYIGLVDMDYNHWKPVGVFSSEKKAKEGIDKKMLELKYIDSWDIIECKLNEVIKENE